MGWMILENEKKFTCLLGILTVMSIMLSRQGFSAIVLVVLWLLLLLYGISFRTSSEEILAPGTVTSLRGICAIEIMLGHIGIATENIFLFPNRKAGILFVGIFFLFSGYGLAYSVEHKRDYLHGF